MSDVVTVLMLVAIGVICWGVAWRYRAWRRRQAADARLRALTRTRTDARQVVARAESLAELALLVHMQPALSTMWEVVGQELVELWDSARGLRRRARTFAFWRATRRLEDALRQLDCEVSRCRSLCVPEWARNTDEWTSAATRLRETSVELAIEARFMGIVADVEGC